MSDDDEGPEPFEYEQALSDEIDRLERKYEAVVTRALAVAVDAPRPGSSPARFAIGD